MKGTPISVKEAAKKLALSPQQVRNLCRDKKLGATKVGNSWVLTEEQLQAYKTTHSCGTTQDHVRKGKKGNSKSAKQPIALSFFSGAMGLDLGIERAGFHTILACEVDKASRKTIAKNRPDIALIGDIRDHSAESIRTHAGIEPDTEIDLIVGGPPCQAFSTAGKRKGFEDQRGNVFLTYLDRIIELQPKFAVIENVRGILSAALKHRPHDQRGKDHLPLTELEMKGGALRHILHILRSAGYGVSFNLYNAANFGTPQKRERVVIVAARSGERLPYLQPTHAETKEFGLPKWRSFKSAVRGLPANMQHLNFPEKRLKFYRMLGPGQYWKHLPLERQREALGKSFHSGGGKTGFFRRLAWNKPAPTLVTHPAMPATDLAHPEEDRPLSIQEYKRIQQFPDNWSIEGSLIDQYKQVGNAVPVGLGEAIGKLIMAQLKNEDVVNFPDFKYSRYRHTSDQAWEAEIDKDRETERKTLTA